MGDNIGDVVDATHDFPWVDEEGDATRHCGPLVVGGAHHPVRGADHLVDVGQEREREQVLVSEPFVRCGIVEGRSEHNCPQIGERWASITQALAFNRSTQRVRFRKPPQHDPRVRKVGERNHLAMLIRKSERRCGHPVFQHPPILPRFARRAKTMTERCAEDAKIDP